jgi:hypothetical protein
MKLHLTYEFESEAELRSHLAVETRATPGPLAEAFEKHMANVETVAVEEIHLDTRSSTDVDGDQMPYDAAVHSDPPQFTGDGLWRAKRGKSEEAKAARAAFKARGGAVVAPVIDAAPSLPGMPAVAPSLPGMPTALPADAPEPITLERVIEKITGMMSRNTLGEATLSGLYAKHSGQADPTASFQVFNTNESARASLYGELCQMEPDLK